MIKHTHQIELIRFAKEHDYIITPLGWEKHIKVYSIHGHCPCDFERPLCPCPEAVKEINDTGHCKCSLFWRSYDTYLAQCYPDEWPP